MTTQVFQIAPAASKAMWGLVVLPAIIMLLVTPAWWPRLPWARVPPGSKCRLRAFVSGRCGRRFIPASALRTD